MKKVDVFFFFSFSFFSRGDMDQKTCCYFDAFIREERERVVGGRDWLLFAAGGSSSPYPSSPYPSDCIRSSDLLFIRHG